MKKNPKSRKQVRAFSVLFPMIFLFCCSTSNKTTFATDHGAIVRGDSSQRQFNTCVLREIPLPMGPIIFVKILKKHKVEGAFFLTGNFYRNPGFNAVIEKSD